MRHTGLTKSQRGSIAWAPPLLLAAYSTVCDAFLPEGYPSSVSDDYLAYQGWDTLQALCSSVTGTLSTRAVLQGFGVGQAEATLLSGTLSWVLRDCVGMVARLFLAAHMASDLDNDNKMWRLIADVTNDLAMMLEIFSACLPESLFMICVCLASILRAVCAVSGGSSRASLTQHFALRRNTADVSAKDGSQETAASFVGMWVGMWVAYIIPATSLSGTAAVFLLFTGAHLYFNYRAVCAVCVRHFNQVRAHLCMTQFLKDGSVPSCAYINTIDVLHRTPLTVVFGAPLSESLPYVDCHADVESALHSHFFSVVSCQGKFWVILRDGCATDDMLLAYFMCVSTPPDFVGVVSLSSQLRSNYSDFTRKAREAGYGCANPQFRIRDWRVKSLSE